MNKTLDYLAGIVDGEGYIGVHLRKGTSTKSPSFWITVNIGMKNAVFIALLQQEYGGTISKLKSGVTYLGWDSHQAAAFLTMIIPYLVVKRQVAEMTLEFHNRQQKLRKVRPAKTTRTGKAPLTQAEIDELTIRHGAIRAAIHGAYN